MLFFCPGVSPPWSFTHCSIIELLYEHSTQNYPKTGLIFAAFGHFMSYIQLHAHFFRFLYYYILFFSLIQYYLLTYFLLSCKKILLQSMIINSCWQSGV